ncbi:hypothetical protein PQX77_014449 [Marasmius sp. AFHP31]|nr:hypothetical protein PQX77_014449 [Marasmius sp. AFHP31]
MGRNRDTVPPEFFLEVKRNRTAPVWSHPSLVPLDDSELPELEPIPGKPESEASETAGVSVDDGNSTDGNSTDDEYDYQAEVEQRLAKDATYQERMEHIIRDLHSFADSLQYQMQFRDERFLTRLELQRRGFMSMMQSCLERERRENSSRVTKPGTWDPNFSSAMFYCSQLAERSDERD